MSLLIDLTSSNPPSWVYTGAVLDFDFTNGRYFQQGQTNDINQLLTVARTTSGGGIASADQINGTFNTFADNVARITSKGLYVETTRNNLFRSSFAPATQTRTVSNGTQYIISCYGSGSVTLSDAISGSVTQGNPVVATAGSTSLTFTIVGSLTAVQCESATVTNPTTPVSTASGASSTRSIDIITLKYPPSFITPQTSFGTGFIIFYVPNNSSGGTFWDMNDGTNNNRLTSNFIGNDGQCGTTIQSGGGPATGYDPDIPYVMTAGVTHCFALTWDAAAGALTTCLDNSPIGGGGSNNPTGLTWPIGMNNIAFGTRQGTTAMNGYIKRFILAPYRVPQSTLPQVTLALKNQYS